MQLVAILRKGIADGSYPAGTATPSITTLSQQYGHARQTCSKALNVLVKEGLLARRLQTGQPRQRRGQAGRALASRAVSP